MGFRGMISVALRKLWSVPNAAVAVKYRDPNTGATWSGRGRSLKWLKGKNAADFLMS